MSGSRTNSWGDPIRFSQTLAGQAYSKSSPHAEMSWTVCYDDDCEIHLCEKQGSGWFPQRRNRKGPNRGKGKGKGVRRDLDEHDPENKPWGDGGDGGGCPIPTEEEVRVILAQKAAREAGEAKAKAAAGVNKEVQIGCEEEEAKPSTKTTQGVKPKATAEVKSDWAEKIRELLAGGVKAEGGARLNTPKHTNNSSGRSPAEAVVKPVPSAGNPTPAVVRYVPRCGRGQFASPNRSTIASANFNSGFEKKQFAPPVATASTPAKFNPAPEKKLFASQPIATAKTPQKTDLTYPHTTATLAVHSPTIDKKRFTSPPVAAMHAPAIFGPQLEKKQFASPPATNHYQKQPLQPRKDQSKTNPYPKPSKTSRQNSPVTTILPTGVIAARAAAKAKLAAEREEKHPQMVKYNQVISTGTGMV